MAAILSNLRFPIELDDFGEKMEYTIVLRRRTAQEYNATSAALRNASGDNTESNKIAVELFDKLFLRIEGLQDAEGHDLATIEHVEEELKWKIIATLLSQRFSLKNSSRTSTSSEPEKKSSESEQTNQ